MKCAVHPDVDATGYCRNCGKPMCPVCVRQVRDVLYCEDCLARIMGIPAAPPPAPPAPAPDAVPPAPAPAPVYAQPPYPPPSRSGASPALAFFLGFIPGLGAVYNGEYNKAIIHVIVFATLIIGIASDVGTGATVALSLLLAFFVFYMAFDAYRSAAAKRRGEISTDPLEDWSRNRPVGPIILIVLGVIFLANNLNLFPFFEIRRFFVPLVLISIGILMFKNRLGRS